MLGMSKTFAPAWHETDATSLEPTHLPLRKLHRAWERQPQSPFARRGKYRKVWRRYESVVQRSLAPAKPSQNLDAKSPVKIVKKLCLSGVGQGEELSTGAGARKPLFAATRVDRKRGVLPRKVSKSRPLAHVSRGVMDNLDQEGPHNAVSDSSPSLNILREEGTNGYTAQKDLEDTECSSGVLRNLNEAHCPRDQNEHGAVECNEREDANEHPMLHSLVEDLSHDVDATGVSADQSIPAEQSIPAHPTATLLTSQCGTKSDLAPGSDHSENLADDLGPVKEEPSEDVSSECLILVDSRKETTQDSSVLEELPNSIQALLESEETSMYFDPTRKDGGNDQLEELAPDQSQAVVVQEVDSPVADCLIAPLSAEDESLQTAPICSSDLVAPESPTQRLDSALIDVVQLGAEKSSPELNLVSASESPRNIPDSNAEQLTDSDLHVPGITLDQTTNHVAQDTAFLQAFLDRAAASKANRVASHEEHERSTIQSESEPVAQAFVSPRKALGEKDPNLSSPTKKLRRSKRRSSSIGVASEGNLSPAMLLKESMDNDLTSLDAGPNPADECVTESAPQTPSTRRSLRTRSRIPPPNTPSIAGPNRIPVRRPDGSEPVILKKTEAQELAILTRNNTRRNKGGAVLPLARLDKLAEEAPSSPTVDDPNSAIELQPELERKALSEGERGVKWSTPLESYQTNSAMVAGSSLPDFFMSEDEPEHPEPKKTVSRVRRMKGLGATNGTPAKGLAPVNSLLPDSIVEEVKVAKSAKVSRKSKKERTLRTSRSSKTKSVKLREPTAPTDEPVTDDEPEPDTAIQAQIGIRSPPKKAPGRRQMDGSVKKSRLASPKKLKLVLTDRPPAALPGPASITTPKDDAEELVVKKTRIATPRKRGIPVPKSSLEVTTATLTTQQAGSLGRRRVGGRIGLRGQ